MTDDRRLMALALAEARRAGEQGEIPIGAVVAIDNEVVAARHNEREGSGDPTAHAEMLALRDAASALGTSRLDGAVLATTLEPCPMCAGAAVVARVARVVFAAEDPKAGACGTLYNLGTDPRLNHNFEVISGVHRDEAAALLQAFFAALRREPRKQRLRLDLS
ncbi:nucleoside deaminase [Candidatus Poriferisocius sp.]|uniref:nucleoside deaminase n=1 Tax=Candidatus Poriferisocius sp. TaxID=3101276 RepID=UPI003B0234ED